MKIKVHSSDFKSSDYGNPEDVLLLKEIRNGNKYIYIYKILKQDIKMPEDSIRYMASYYELGKWYSVIKYFKNKKEALGYYININYPPKLEGAVMKIKDLFLDIWVNPDYSYKILDKDEFREAIDKGVLQNELAKKVLETKNEIIDKINRKILLDKMLIDLTLEKY